ncbi:glycoside hydrolase family 26 protein [Mucilaginibacter myungsuensis]|uniref:GH26 domain-containing protein n=1 Tax=Mucilaginibacter myungsuensis TaxID=649104 RepID=A0A929L602_9SPHI|nr:hypothetical protein [Mucilaginibacter myungsuensis]MBE9664605.1 hypothetical protein [Mucilaginibacter myungsuensis]MDN3601045.1 hypothetical protein [Mucilaginibacter myungsuensis]
MNKGDVLLTVETWLKGLSSDNVLEATLSGKFDRNIDDLGRNITFAKHRVYLRWNPDMEVPVQNYPWQFRSAQLYRRAFDHVAKRIKKIAPQTVVIWGPTGYPGDTEYWPGNQYVDMVSITLGSRSEFIAKNYPIQKDIKALLRSKLHRMRYINKPILVLTSDRFDKKLITNNLLNEQTAYMRDNSEMVYSAKLYADTEAIKPVRARLHIGVYDPDEKLTDLPGINVEHIFTDIGELQKGLFKKKFDAITKRGHDVILTVEPWRDTSNISDTDVTKSILNGRYNNVIKNLFRIIGTTERVVYLRWMHEMEIPIHRYPWQSRDPVSYIKAFRYFMLFDGGTPKNVKKVWGPAGDRGSVDFWPGDDVVDYISIAIYGLPDKNITDPNLQESFKSAFYRKYYRMRFLDKPLFITEFGVKGPQTYQDAWLAGASVTIKENRHIFGISYFNQVDNPAAWGKIKAPNWAISKASMQKFIKAVNDDNSR